MPESDPPNVMNLLYAIAGLLALLLVLMVWVHRRLSRIERHLIERSSHQQEMEAASSSLEASAGGAFETFLNEDPAIREMPKGEQLAEYRKWRQKKGLNWSNS